MNKIVSIVLLHLLFCGIISSQCDYSTAKYAIGVDKGLLYGVLPDFQGKQDSLFLDVYYPVGSPENYKPMVIWAFGGGFFQGAREDFASVCKDLAARGMVSVTIDYRIGFDGPSGLNPPFAYDKAEILRAAYRGVTDMKGAIRFMKAKYQVYGIDLERIWSGGASAGSIVALNAAFLDKESEKPVEVGATKPINNKQRPDLGPIDGTLNLNGYDSKVQGVFNFFGAVLDTNEIDASDKIAVMSYHQTNDPIVPCVINTPYYQVAFIASNYPVVFGTCAITDRLQHIGLDPKYFESWIYPGSQHAAHDETAVINFMLLNAKPLLCKNLSAVSEEESALAHAYLNPNPADHSIRIENSSDHFQYIIYDLSGNSIMKDQIAANRTIDVSSFQPGMYMIKILNKGSSRIFKWIKS
jgi:predicted esterase